MKGTDDLLGVTAGGAKPLQLMAGIMINRQPNIHCVLLHDLAGNRFVPFGEKFVIGLRVNFESGGQRTFQRAVLRNLGGGIKQQDQFQRKRMRCIGTFEDSELAGMSVLTQDKVRRLQVRGEVLTSLDVERNQHQFGVRIKLWIKLGGAGLLRQKRGSNQN